MKPSDVAVIGSGPHALAVVARLLDPFPPRDEFTEREHYEYSQEIQEQRKNKHKHKTPHVVVFDESGEWLRRWKEYFRFLDIPNLRSQVTHHPDPRDEQALLEFAFRNGREKELSHANRLVTQAARRTHKDRNLAHAHEHLLPSASLFVDFCEDLVKRMELEKLIVSSRVTAITPLVDKGPKNQPWFRISGANGLEHVTKRVVVAIGNTNLPRIPDWTQPYQQYIRHSYQAHCDGSLSDTLRCCEQQDQPLKRKRILIVGCGLTGCHLCIKYINAGHDVTLFVRRSQIQVEQFDAPSNWTGLYQRAEFAHFLASAPETRLSLIKKARGSGSCSPEVYERICHLVQRHPDRFSISYNTTIRSLKPLDSGSPASAGWHVAFSQEDSLQDEVFDDIQLATGSVTDLSKEPLLSQILKAFPVKLVDGFPVLFNDSNLSWHRKCRSLHVIGGYGAISLGPMAHNLFGAIRASRLLYDVVVGQNYTKKDDELPARKWEQYNNPFDLLTDLPE